MHKLLPMRVLIINTSERIGGAAIAASRLMESLKNNGIKAKMLVRDKQTDQISVVRLKSNWLQVWKFMWERIVIWSANRFRRYHLFDVDIAKMCIRDSYDNAFRTKQLGCYHIMLWFSFNLGTNIFFLTRKKKEKGEKYRWK